MLNSGKTIIELEGDDVVVVRHGDGIEIVREELERGLALAKEHYPDARLLLVDHRNSYSMSSCANLFLSQQDYFRVIASLVYDEKTRGFVDGYFKTLEFKVPTGVFLEKAAALEFLRSQ